MTQSQRTRWIKTAAIVLAIVTLFYFVSPKGVEVYNGGGAASGGMDYCLAKTAIY